MMRMLARAIALVGATFAMGTAATAFAADAVQLRPDAAGHDGVVTLGDLFADAGAASAVVVGRAPAGQEAVLDAGEVQLAARRAGLDWPNANGQRRIIVAVAAGPANAAHRGHKGHATQVLVYAHNVQAGEILQADDLQWSDEAVGGADTVDRPDMAIGKAARMPLREGSAVAAHDLTSPKVIKRDQMIAVDFSDGGVSLSLTAKAMNDAAVGDAVQVQNTSSKKIIEAVATAPGHAAVGPGADAARAQTLAMQ